MQHLISQIIQVVPKTVDVDISAAAGITTGSTTSSIGILSLGKVIETGAGAILSIGGLATFVYLLMGGFNWVTAGGDKSKIETARTMITQAIIGLAILASVFALFGILTRFFGIQNKIDVGNYGAGSSSGGGSPSCSNLTKAVCDKTSGCTWNGASSPPGCIKTTGGGGGDCTVGVTAEDGGAGRYCSTTGTDAAPYTNAKVKCVDKNYTSVIPYNHWEPCLCLSGTKVAGKIFTTCN